MHEYRWIFTEQPDPDAIKALSKSININPVLTTILLQRGIHHFEQAKTYFRPDISQLHDPFIMKDMDRAIDLLIQSIEKKEKIMIYGDYDVDGTTSVALVYGYLSQFYDNLKYYINDRESEGYGISEKGIRFAHDHGVSLIISLDCGIKAVNYIQLARDLGMNFIVCDHHTPGEAIPIANAVLDPKQSDCPYPYKELSGCGIGYKLLQAYEQKSGIDQNLGKYLDLVAVSISADIVPLTGENRILCNLGMKVLNQDPCPGLSALIELYGKPTMNVSNVIFGIAPKINAAGRLAHANQAVELLLARDKVEAHEMARLINERNTERQDFDQSITEQALRKIKREGKGKKSTVLFDKDWHKGVIGIVASRCIEHHYKPTIILTQSNGSATGSARSVPGFDIYSAIEKCEYLLDKFGGHPFAAGLTLSVDNIEEFSKKFEEVVAESINEDQLSPTIEIDTELPFDYISDKFLSILEQMEPFGPNNPIPTFLAHNVYVRSGLRLLKEKHLKFVAGQDGSMNAFEAIGFGLGHYIKEISKNPPMSIAFTVEANEYMGVRSLQLRIKDIKFEEYGA